MALRPGGNVFADADVSVYIDFRHFLAAQSPPCSIFPMKWIDTNPPRAQSRSEVQFCTGGVKRCTLLKNIDVRNLKYLLHGAKLHSLWAGHGEEPPKAVRARHRVNANQNQILSPKPRRTRGPL